MDATQIVAIYAALGDLDDAFAWLERAADERSAIVPRVRVDPEFAPLRSDPRYAKFLARIGLPTHGPPGGEEGQ